LRVVTNFAPENAPVGFAGKKMGAIQNGMNKK
jgi:hypothetical protein